MAVAQAGGTTAHIHGLDELGTVKLMLTEDRSKHNLGSTGLEI